MQAPTTWNECHKLLRSPELALALQVRLVELAFMAKNDAVSVKAIDILNSMSKPASDDMLTDVPVEKLLELEARVDAWLEKVVADE